MNKYIFLDIDGVLNSGKYIIRLDGQFDDPKYQIDPAAVARLNTITDLTGAKIVVSSTWRLAFINEPNGVALLRECLQSYGITGDIVDMTIDKSRATRNQRGKEIQVWVDYHISDIEKFVIIDDDVDMGRMRKHLIKTLFDDGLEDHHVKTIVDILGTK